MGHRAKLLAGIGAVTATIAAVAALALSSNAVPSAAERTCALGETQLGGFVDIPGGGFVMGVDPLYPEEGPPRRVLVSPFRLQAHEVTSSQFAAFVAETGYLTEAERNGGSAQFNESDTPEAFQSWWSLDAQATWRTPDGAGSDLTGRDLHPVVHVTLNDAWAYAAWAGGRLPTEVEWEYAASRGALRSDGPRIRHPRPDGTARANIWTGIFPVINSRRDGFAGTAPLGCYEPGLTGAYDMIGKCLGMD
jgi:formylglycine-generating enzyme required for sulfatase activity